MAKRSREDNLAVWSIRLLRVLNLLIILGSIAFLTFEIQFERHPAEFGWSLIMIAIITILSGLIGCVSSGRAGWFFPLMFFIFMSFMGLFSLSVLLFVRPDEVARKLLTLHISLSSATHHLFIDAYFFSLLGFLQLLIFALSYLVRKRAYVDYYGHLDIPFQQPRLTSADEPVCNRASTRTSAVILPSKGSKQDTHFTSSALRKVDAQSPEDHPIHRVSSVDGAVHEGEILSPKKETPAALGAAQV